MQAVPGSDLRGLSNAFVESLAIDPTKPSTLYAGTDSGYFVTTNGATSWTAGNSLFNFNKVTPLAVDPGNSSHLLLGDDALGGELWQSTNSGSNWSQSSLQSAPVNALVFDHATPANVYAGSNLGSDMFVTEFVPAGNALIYSTYLGGSGWDAGDSIAFNPFVGAYVGGASSSSDFSGAAPVASAPFRRHCRRHPHAQRSKSASQLQSE